MSITPLLALVNRLGPHHPTLAPLLFALLRRICRARNHFTLDMKRAAAGWTQLALRPPRKRSGPRAPKHSPPFLPQGFS